MDGVRRPGPGISAGGGAHLQPLEGPAASGVEAILDHQIVQGARRARPCIPILDRVVAGDQEAEKGRKRIDLGQQLP